MDNTVPYNEGIVCDRISEKNHPCCNEKKFQYNGMVYNGNILYHLKCL